MPLAKPRRENDDMAARRDPWLGLGADLARLGMEASAVAGLRMFHLASGAGDAPREMALMVSEKAHAAWDAQFLVAKSLMAGRPDLAAQRTVALYRRRVQANRRRLAKT
jgi:hypothetical protein